MRMGRTRGRDDLISCCLRLAISDVFGNRAEEQKGFLQHQADIAAVIRHGKAPQVDTVYPDRSLGHVIETADQIDQRAFARSRMSDQTDHLAGFDFQIKPADNGAVAIAKADVVHRDAALDHSQLDRIDRLGHVRDMVKNVEDSLGAGRRPLRDRDNATHRIHAPVKAADISDKSGQHADRNLLIGNQPDAAGPDHQQAHFSQ